MAKEQRDLMSEAYDRLMAEIDHDVEIMAARFTGGELTADTVEVTPADYKDFRFSHWGDEKKRVEWAQSMEPQAWLDEAFDIIAPAASKAVRSEFGKMLEAGVPAPEATRLAQQLHEAELMRYEAMHPDPNKPPPLLAAMVQTMAPMPVPMPEPMPAPVQQVQPSEAMPPAPPPMPLPPSMPVPPVAGPVGFVPPGGV